MNEPESTLICSLEKVRVTGLGISKNGSHLAYCYVRVLRDKCTPKVRFATNFYC